ncbi:PS_pyruv_trans domain-containing protein [Vibrio chagasii]|nr:PS_pyruv_trans domain-containing protein [Vibrio chagasii]
MKIAIVTFPLINNYGGIIQAYAMVELLKDLGHQPVLINLQPESKFKAIGKYLIKKYILIKPKKNKNYPKLVRDKKLHGFIVKNITPLSKEIRNSAELHIHFEEEPYDACIVGSDQVFASMGFTNFKNDFSLGFMSDDILKLSYAGSFGGNKFRGDPSMVSVHANNLSRFDAVSVRENSAINVCDELFGIKATHVLDPTMMIDKTSYLDILGYSQLPKNKAELFAYVLDSSEDKQRMLNKLAQDRSITLTTLNDGNKSGKVISMEEWLKSILLAEHVITDSFHGCVFCIIFNKPFNCFVNEDRGADRFYSLLELFGLESRAIINDSSSIDYTDIDWNDVNKRLDVLRGKSKEFLTRNLIKK